jgi:hypothetical protein
LKIKEIKQKVCFLNWKNKKLNKKRKVADPKHQRYMFKNKYLGMDKVESWCKTHLII